MAEFITRPSTPKILILATLAAVALPIVACATAALASDGAPPATGALTPSALAWVGFGNAVLLLVGQWTDPANMSTPWDWTGPKRAAVFALVTFLIGVLKAFTDAPGVPWTETLFTSVLTLGPGLFAHFSPGIFRPSPAKARGFVTVRALVASVIAMGLALAGCAWLQGHPQTVTDGGKTLACIEQHAAEGFVQGETPLQVLEGIAVACATDIATVVTDLNESKATFAPYSKAAAVHGARAALSTPPPWGTK